MELELKRGGRTARVETLGGELVSYRDERGLEYIWGGDPAYWPGRNPLLFPIVGTLKEGKIRFDGREYAMERHGFARRREFTPAARGEDWVRLELRESAETLALYPYPFRLAVEQRLTDTGFSTAVTVANPGEGPLPFCLGAHTGFRCPLEAGERFEDYELVFPERESCPTLLLRDGLLDRPAALPYLEDTDTLPLDYRWFDALDTLIFEGLRSRSVTLRSRKSGRGVRVSFDGFPMLAFWTMPGKKAPYLCIEPWHGCAAGTAEGPEFTDKAHCIVLAPGDPSVFGTDPGIIISWWNGDNVWTKKRDGWQASDPESFNKLQSIMDEAVQLDGDAAKAKWGEAQDLLAEKTVIFPLVFRNMITGSNPQKVEGFQPISSTGLQLLGVSAK